MNSKSISLFVLFGLFIYLTSCSKNDNPTPDPDPKPDPIDTTTIIDTTVIDTTTHIDTNSNNSKLTFPTTFIFKNTVIAETEYYQILQNGRLKVNEPYYMRYSKNLLQSSIKDDHGLPFKEIQIVSSDKLTIIYKDNSVAANLLYTLKNSKDVFLNASGYLGTLSSDNSIFNLNLSPYTYSNISNRPMYPRLYLCISHNPDKNQTMDFLGKSQGLQTGDTLAVNFSLMVYQKK